MRVLLIAVLFWNLACSNEPQAQKAVAPVVKGLSPTAPVTTAAPTTASRDTTIPRTRYVVDTSRPTNEIDRKFPFDISMTDGLGKATSSDQVMAPNGKPTVLLFWLTTCYPCKMQMREIKKHYEAWQEEVDFNFYAISTDFQMRYPRYLELVKEHQWPWPAFHDTNREFRKVLPGGLNGLPQVFVLNDEGEVLYHRRKYLSGDEFKLFDQLKAIAAAN